ncbi:MAG TPA: LemA family protein [Ruminococcaceae bacterium]|nr:LemA family protein [Oscillospiraceae bacterium]
MKNGIKVLIAVIAVVVVIIGIFAGGYNSLVKAQTAVETKQADIQTQLQRRADLIPNFVSTVKGYSKYEQETLTAVTEARAKVSKASDAQSLSQANDELDKAISVWVNAVTEAYPDLKANQSYIALQDELAGTENRIAVARKDYNEAVQSYNTMIKTFPKNILAGMFGFEKAEFFTASESSQTVPNVEF